jgi:hypothetical protein
MGDEAAVDEMAAKFGALVDLWLALDEQRRPDGSEVRPQAGAHGAVGAP